MPMKTPEWIKNFGKVEEVSVTEESFLRHWRTWAFRILALLIVVATITGLVESYHGLYEWFYLHGSGGDLAYAAPIAIDFFTVIGELAIFTAITGGWSFRKRLIPWVSVLIGFGGSVAGNIGRVEAHHPWTWDLTAMVFPMAAAFGILIGFSVLKSLAKEVADKSYKSGMFRVDSMAVSKEGLKEVEEEAFRAKVPSLEAPQLKGLDALIPPRAAFPPAPVPVAEDGGNTTTEWRGLPDGAHKLRRPDFQTQVRNTGSFPQVP